MLDQKEKKRLLKKAQRLDREAHDMSDGTGQEAQIRRSAAWAEAAILYDRIRLDE